MNPGTFQGPGLGYVPIWGKPERVTTYTSGTGTYKPTEANAWCYVILVGGGGGGRQPSNTSTPTTGGGGGCVYQTWIKITSSAGVSYAVGAGGAAGTAGGNTTFSTLTATGGRAGCIISSGYIPASGTVNIPSFTIQGNYTGWGSTGTLTGQYNIATDAVGYGGGGIGGNIQFVDANYNNETTVSAGSGGLIIVADYGA